MERSRFSTITSLLAALLFAGTIVLGGCSNSLTGTSPDRDQTVQQSETDDVTTEPVAGHNTSAED